MISDILNNTLKSALAALNIPLVFFQQQLDLQSVKRQIIDTRKSTQVHAVPLFGVSSHLRQAFLASPHYFIKQYVYLFTDRIVKHMRDARRHNAITQGIIQSAIITFGTYSVDLRRTQIIRKFFGGALSSCSLKVHVEAAASLFIITSLYSCIKWQVFGFLQGIGQQGANESNRFLGAIATIIVPTIATYPLTTLRKRHQLGLSLRSCGIIALYGGVSYHMMKTLPLAVYSIFML